MTRILLLAVLLFPWLALTACQTATSTSTNALSNAAAAANSQTGVDLAQTVCGSMGKWAEGGGITGVNPSGLSGSSVSAKTLTGPDANGYYHLVESTTTILGTYEADLYVKLASSEGKVSDVYLYGTYSWQYAAGGSSLSYTESFGSSSSPYRATATWLGNDVTSIAISGSLGFNIASTTPTEGSHTIAMTFTFSSYSLPVTSGNDYPTGSINIATTYDGVAQPTITLTCNGTATATISYGTFSSSITIGGV